MKKFIYYPSFSVGEFCGFLKKDYKIKGEIPCRFYGDDFPRKYKHEAFLITGGHHYKEPDFRNDIGISNDVLTLGDSGGYQIASGAIKWELSTRETIFNWLENNSDIAVNLDIPPRMTYDGRYQECLDISRGNFKYFADHQSGRTKFLNVIHGVDFESYKNWYSHVNDFSFNGWCIGGASGSLYRFMSALVVLLSGKEHLKTNNEYLHILGASKIIDFMMLLKLQKSLEDIGSKIIVSTDSSSPCLMTAFGRFVSDFNVKKQVFETINFPNEKHNKDIIGEFKTINHTTWPIITGFDNLLNNVISWRDVVEWNHDCRASMVLHNFMVFKKIVDVVENYIYGHDFILKQVMDNNTFLLLQSIDQMVRSDDPATIFEKYKPLYMKLSNIHKPFVIKENKFF